MLVPEDLWWSRMQKPFYKYSSERNHAGHMKADLRGERVVDEMMSNAFLSPQGMCGKQTKVSPIDTPILPVKERFPFPWFRLYIARSVYTLNKREIQFDAILVCYLLASSNLAEKLNIDIDFL